MIVPGEALFPGSSTAADETWDDRRPQIDAGEGRTGGVVEAVLTFDRDIYMATNPTELKADVDGNPLTSWPHFRDNGPLKRDHPRFGYASVQNHHCSGRFDAWAQALSNSE
jgi:hypothetical protein